MTKPSRKKVVILGGGIAGLSAAHELVADGRDFEVEVFERKTIAGGKARSLPAEGPSLGSSQVAHEGAAACRRLGPQLPGEHGFRFFPGFYKHVVDTMSRIPYRGGVVADNLVNATEVLLASFDGPAYSLPAQFPRNAGDVQVSLAAISRLVSGSLGISAADTSFFALKIWQLLTSCSERRLVEYERTNWWDYIEAEGRSPDFQKYFGSGITRSLVAAKARRASTRTIGDIFLQIIIDIVTPGGVADRLLNGPTNHVWIDPWVGFLRSKGVVYHTSHEIRAIRSEQGLVRSVVVGERDGQREVRADYFIAALPIERMVRLLNPSLLALDPSLGNLDGLSEYLEWMNGIQFYLREDVPLAHGHGILIDSPWALTCVSQAQFWKNVRIEDYADGTVRGILSVDISDWDVKGLNGKAAQHCSRAEIAAETWQQLKRSLNHDRELLKDENLHSWFLDPGIDDSDADGTPSTPRINTNAEPLLVNYVDTWRLRPEAVTRIPNFFLASDYVRTHTDLATMEAANEAARRAVNGILRASRSSGEHCTIWNLHEPEALAPLRAHDRVRFRRGLPWQAAPAHLADFLRAQSADPDSDPSDANRIASLARASSDAQLSRLRIRRTA